ncbi:Mu transposase domain-containing protein [Elizabethkingia ursingii]|uniref:Mu transposase domain-containing protein n=1 Tax=Elizabethkingia ursingii TaxID=1756150 RepID=UPI0021A86FEE|nr:hypothetical protein [Elizabethkingia ursingii]
MPSAIVPDNLKSAVKKSHRYEPEITQSLSDLALYYDTTILPARAYHPKDKALVENAVRIVYTRVFAPLRTQQFFDLQSLNKSIKELLEVHNNLPLSRERIARRALFEDIEKSALRQLPEIPYQVKDFSVGTVQKDSHVYLSRDKHYYSVPSSYIGKKLSLIYSKTIVEIYYGSRRIALHQRVYSKNTYSTIEQHMPASYNYLTEWNPNTFIDKACSIGENTEEYIVRILDKGLHPDRAYKLCSGILSLAKKVGNIRLDNACKRALSYEHYTFKAIKSILENGWDTFNDDEDFNEGENLPKHRNIRGGKYYK